MKILAYLLWCLIIVVIFFLSLIFWDGIPVEITTIVVLSGLIVPAIIPQNAYKGILNKQESFLKVDYFSYIAALGAIGIFIGHCNITGAIILFTNLTLIYFIQVKLNNIKNIDFQKHVMPLYIFIIPMILFTSFLIQNVFANHF